MSGGALVENNTVYGQNGNSSSYGIYASDSTVENNTAYGNYDGIYSYGDTSAAITEDNRVYGNTNAGIYLYGYDQLVQGNYIYSNRYGIDSEAYNGGTGFSIVNNLIYANTNTGLILSSGSDNMVTNNTIYQPAGDAILIRSTPAQTNLTNNIIWTDSGNGINVASNSEAVKSDYNVFYLTTGSANIGVWEGKDYTNLVDWSYELGLDMDSTTANPLFVDPNGPDNIMGYSTTPIGSAQIIDDSGAGFSATGSWTTVTGGYDNEHLETTTGSGTSVATYTFTGLTPGATYDLAATWPQMTSYNGSSNTSYYVYDGTNPIAERQVSQYYASSGFTANGATWTDLGAWQVSGTTLTIQVPNIGNNTKVEVDAVRLQQIAGDHGEDDDFHLQSSSPAIDRGDPLSYSLEEPWPSGGRADVGAYGNTPQATASPSQVVQVLSPNGLNKLEVGDQTTIGWRESGLDQTRVVALINAGGGTVTSATLGNWLYNNYQTVSYYNNSFTNAVDTSGVTNPAPQGVYQTYAYANYGVGNSIAWNLPVPDGTYTIQLDFAEPSYTSAGSRKFDISLQGQVVKSSYDIWADAKAQYKATIAAVHRHRLRGQRHQPLPDQ